MPYLITESCAGVEHASCVDVPLYNAGPDRRNDCSASAIDRDRFRN